MLSWNQFIFLYTLSSPWIYLICKIRFMFNALPDTTFCISLAWDRHKQDTGLCPVEAVFIFWFIYLFYFSCLPFVRPSFRVFKFNFNFFPLCFGLIVNSCGFFSGYNVRGAVMAFVGALPSPLLMPTKSKMSIPMDFNIGTKRAVQHLFSN